MSYSLPADYVDVAERIRQFREKYPEGSLQCVDWGITDTGEKLFVHYVAAAYRTPDDERPGIGTAWEPYPGPTPYTRDSELMNAETSAWGRAIIAAGAADAKRVASANEVANRQSPKMQKQRQITHDQVDRSGYVFNFGKHKGAHIVDVPSDYLQYLLKQPARPGYEEQHAENHKAFEAELARRNGTTA